MKTEERPHEIILKNELQHFSNNSIMLRIHRKDWRIKLKHQEFL